jgi:hypothetical protein
MGYGKILVPQITPRTSLTCATGYCQALRESFGDGTFQNPNKSTSTEQQLLIWELTADAQLIKLLHAVRRLKANHCADPVCGVLLRGDLVRVLQVYEGMVQQLEVNPVSIRQQQEALAANPAAVLPPLGPAGGPIAELPSDQAALVWIQYMRFSRRSESVTASRKVRSRLHKLQCSIEMLADRAATLQVARSTCRAGAVFTSALRPDMWRMVCAFGCADVHPRKEGPALSMAGVCGVGAHGVAARA